MRVKYLSAVKKLYYEDESRGTPSPSRSTLGILEASRNLLFLDFGSDKFESVRGVNDSWYLHSLHDDSRAHKIQVTFPGSRDSSGYETT